MSVNWVYVTRTYMYVPSRGAIIGRTLHLLDDLDDVIVNVG